MYFHIHLFCFLIHVAADTHFNWKKDILYPKYATFKESDRKEALSEVRHMFQFGWDNYIKHAFPHDELDPIHCTGRGHDHENPENININDVLGDYSLTLIDSLDTVAIMGNVTEFKKAVDLVIKHVSFDKPVTVQVFEATIRVVGGLLSAHLLIKDKDMPFGNLSPDNYDNELLELANDLASRLLPAFLESDTGIPYPRVDLKNGLPKNTVNETCTSGAGTLVLEFGILSRLVNDPVYERVARRAVKSLWKFRSNVTGLFGNLIDIRTGKWIGKMSGLGAGLDSLFEYFLKAFVLFGEDDDKMMFNESYETIKFYLRKGRKHCNNGTGMPPLYVNVDMWSGDVLNNWIDSLQASWPAVQVLNGDIDEAICTHALYYAIWRRFDGLPERYDWHRNEPNVFFYPLRPELIESTYILYKATKNPFYLHVGRDILTSIKNYTKVECGYATVHNVMDKNLEDRMESFFLSETLKYLYLLFDKDNPLNKDDSKYLFSTEGHLFPVSSEMRKKPWESDFSYEKPSDYDNYPRKVVSKSSNFSDNCSAFPKRRSYELPLQAQYLYQIETYVGLHTAT